MFEKVNPGHPDKIADRIAGALVDLAYKTTGGIECKDNNPRIAVEVLIGHGECNIICETSVSLNEQDVRDIVRRIMGGLGGAGDIRVRYKEFPQDVFLAANQDAGVKCGDNGIFRGVPVWFEEKKLLLIAQDIYKKYPYDGKYVLDLNGRYDKKLVVCQSNAKKEELENELEGHDISIPTSINPLGYWTGGTDVDTGATNRKLGSDMGHAVTGGGLHGKDLSKADVSVNIYCHLLANEDGEVVEASCAIGDENVLVRGVPVSYKEIVEKAREYIISIGGFERFAEWGLIR